MLDNRILAARGCLKAADADLLIISSLHNIRYFSGFTGTCALLILSQQDGWLITDSRYTSQARAEVTGAQVLEYSVRMEGLSKLVSEQGGKRIAFEAQHTTVASHREMVAAFPSVEFVALDKELDSIRIVKDAGELLLLEETARIASEALLETLPSVRPGVAESEIALMLEIAMRRKGAQGPSFDFIVASGERGALPHGRASEKLIQKGELVTIDYGAICRGYCSDETVTVSVGEPDSRQREIYEVVRVAQELAIDAVRPGISVKELDDIARGYIDRHGFGQYFGHGLGHGIGIEIHELPTVSFRSTVPVEEGMVFTIEPGIYIPGWGGVRIEDSVVVERDGCRRITRVPKELKIC